MNSKLLALSAYFQNILFNVSESLSPEEQKFQSYMAEYNKSYEDEAEYQLRFGIFKKNLAFVESHESDSFSVGINEMSDWTEQEFGRISGKHHKKQRQSHRVSAGIRVLDTTNLAWDVDWRRNGAVSSAIQ
jgi:hypothetical protein